MDPCPSTARAAHADGTHRRIASAVVATLALASPTMGQSMAAKRLFAPPQDVASGIVVLPNIRDAAAVSQNALLIVPRTDGAAFAFSTGGGTLRISPLAPDAIDWKLSINDGGGAIPLTGTPPKASLTRRGIGRVGERIAVQDQFGSEAPTRSIEVVAPAGSLRVDASMAAAGPSAEVALAVDDDSPVALAAYPAEWSVAAGDALDVVLEARMPIELAGDPATWPPLVERAMAGTALAFTLRNAEVRWSDGTSARGRVVRDDGATVVVRFDRALAGDAAFRIEADVADRAGASAWTRSVAGIASIAQGQSRLLGELRAELQRDGAWMDLVMPVETDESSVFAAAELWAVSARGPRCLGWVGGIAMVEALGRGRQVRIGCETARVPLADDEQLEARNLRLQARDGFAPLALMARASIAAPGLAAASRGRVPIAGEFGIPGIATVDGPERSSLLPGSGAHTLALVHGYCASYNPWPLGGFSADAWQYLRANANLTHDQFARDIFTASAPYKSFGVAAHSQGGCASLHLHTFYWSGMDWAGPGRLIQTLGSPFKGTPMAGNLAALGQVFGVQCGANYDMTTTGATAWLTTVPTSVRARAYTHTTTFTDNPFSYDYCNVLTDGFLTDPEDGVTEHSAGHITGANNMGLKTGWCHIAGMRDPAQATDTERNAVINTQGAR